MLVWLRYFLVKLLGAIALAVAYLFLLLLAGVLIVNLDANGPFIAIACFPLAAMVGQITGVFVHEVGHLLAARLVHIRVRELRSGALTIDFERGGRWRYSNLLGGGHVKPYPWAGVHYRLRVLVFVLGGVAANLLTALAIYTIIGGTMHRPAAFTSDAGFSLATLMHSIVNGDHPLAPKGPIALIVLAIAGWWNLLLIVQSLTPLNYSSGIPSDGKQILHLLSATDKSLKIAAEFLILRDEFQKSRPRDWSPSSLARLAALHDGGVVEAAADTYRYFHALDERRIDDARRFLESALRNRETAQSPGMCYEAAYFCAQFQRNLSAAKDHFARANDRPHTEPQTRLRALAAIQLLAGEFPLARETARQALDAMHDPEDPGGAVAEREWIQEIIQGAEAGQQSVA